VSQRAAEGDESPEFVEGDVRDADLVADSTREVEYVEY
jgi:hypothetical protein